jgi:hypothetical protein
MMMMSKLYYANRLSLTVIVLAQSASRHVTHIFDIFVETLSYRGLCFVDEYTSERVQFVLLSVLSSSMVDRGSGNFEP